MRKESVQKFDLEAAFKALDTVEIPTVKGIRPNREDLQEKFTRKLVTDILVEDYYDVGDTGELEQAQEEREAEVAKAKLARIEKIVDLDAETEDDILPSYVGKFIMQCPQCMTLFYKNEEDIERSEEAPDVVNINEPCQHCGNSSGYTLIGKVGTVGEEEAAQYDVDDFEENELDLNFDEEEASAEEPAEAEEVATEEEPSEDTDLDLDLAPIEDEEEEVQESLSLREEHEAVSLNLDPAIAHRFTKSQLDSLTPEEIKILQNPRDHEGREKIIAKYNPKHPLDEATINISKAEMEKLDKEVEEATKEVAKYNIPMKAQKNSAGETENVPDFEAVPEAQREAAKKAYDRYSKAIAARPDRAKNIIKYTDESLNEGAINTNEGLNESARKADAAELEAIGKQIFKDFVADTETGASLKPGFDNAAPYYFALKLLWKPHFNQDQPDFKTTPEEYVKKIRQETKQWIAANAHKYPGFRLDYLERSEKATDYYLGAIEAHPETTDESLTEEIDAVTKDKLTKEVKEIDEKIAYYENQMKLAKDAADRQDFNRKLDGFYKLRNQKLQLIKDGSLKMADLELEVEESLTAESLTEDVELNKQMDLYNEFIKYLQKMVEQDEDALEEAKKIGNKEVITAIEKRLENSKAELKAALPATIKDEAAENDLPTPEEADMGAAAENKDEPKEKKESLTEATATISRLKRNYSATELMVKELKTIEPFNKLSTRTIQRVLLPYYIENMGREDLSTQALIEFFEYEGFAPYVLDHFMTMDPLARKELLKADEKFMQIFNDYATDYNFFPGKDEILEPGESEFDYAFNIMFDINADGLAHDTELTRNTIRSLGRMYAEGCFDKSLIVEKLTEDAAVDVLFDSEEFKTPISDAEIDKIRAQYEGLEEDIAPGVETEIAINNIVDTWESVEDFDDETFNKLTESYLTEVYSNVKSFKTTNCDLREGRLIVEGTITFNSGKTKPTTFEYEAVINADKQLVLEGLNADFASEKAFTLNCKVDAENRLIVESLGYKYTINDTLVEGLLK